MNDEKYLDRNGLLLPRNLDLHLNWSINVGKRAKKTRPGFDSRYVSMKVKGSARVMSQKRVKTSPKKKTKQVKRKVHPNQMKGRPKKHFSGAKQN